MIRTMNSVYELFDQMGGAAAVGRLIGKGASTASEMKRRGSIPVEYWPVLIESAKGRELGISAEILLRIHANERSRHAEAAQ
jgi:hypothetical protein